MRNVGLCCWVIELVLALFRLLLRAGARIERPGFAVALSTVPVAPDDRLKTSAFGSDSLAYG